MYQKTLAELIGAPHNMFAQVLYVAFEYIGEAVARSVQSINKVIRKREKEIALSELVSVPPKMPFLRVLPLSDPDGDQVGAGLVWCADPSAAMALSSYPDDVEIDIIPPDPDTGNYTSRNFEDVLGPMLAWQIDLLIEAEEHIQPLRQSLKMAREFEYDISQVGYR